jgi:curved DNA-binding protein CbpA
MQTEAFVDYYELMQISPNADSDTVHRVYRILAARFHPDNADSGDAETFRQITDAYHTLGDSTIRAAYDVKHKATRRLNWKIFDQPSAAQGIGAERRKRHGVLELLYRKRIMQPEQPSVGLKELEELLGVPKEHLEFTIWYLKEGGYLTRGDGGRVTITLRGVDLTEELSEQPGEQKSERKALEAPESRVA